MRMESEAIYSANVRLRNQLDVVKMALRFYAKQKHFTVIDSKTVIVDTGGVAEEALNQLEENTANIEAMNEVINSTMYL